MTGNVDPILSQLARWAAAQPTVRAVLLTSTRTNPMAAVDLFSDYDVILAVADVRPFYEDRQWLGAFGPVLVVYRDPLDIHDSFLEFAYITQYENSLKIDFHVMAADLLRHLAALPSLPNELDVGYRILLDKDNLTAGLKPATYRAYIPAPPDEATYQTVVEEFFHETTYVAKLLWRDELMPAKYSLDTVMKLTYLRQMLEWVVESERGWRLKPGNLGKGLKRLLAPGIWSELERCYAGPGVAENWQALFDSIALFREIAQVVAEQLEFAYPLDLDRRMLAYLQKVRRLERPATSFPYP